MRSKAVIIGICSLVIAGLAVAVLVLNQPGKAVPAAQETTQQAPTPASTPTAAVTTSETKPTSGELVALQDALASGNSGDVGDLLPLAPTETAAPSFVSTLERMALVIDDSSLKVLASDAWEVQATDKDGKAWWIGLIRAEDTRLRIVYAEEAK